MRAIWLFSAVFLVSEGAAAQACCSGSSANQFGVVARGNRALVGARLGQEVVGWTSDAEGRSSALEGQRVLSTTLALGGGVRLWWERLQIQGTVPVLLQHRAFGDLAETDGGLGDADLNLRLDLLEDETQGLIKTGSFVPFVETHIGVGFPTGRAPAASDRLTQVDVTGTGDWKGRAGVRLSRFITVKDVAFLSGTWVHSFPREIERAGVEGDFQTGEEFDAHLSYRHYPSMFWGMGLAVDYRFVMNAKQDGIVVPESRSRRLTVGAQVSHFLSWPSWQIQLVAGLDPPIDAVSANLPFAGASASLSLVRHFGAANEYQ